MVDVDGAREFSSITLSDKNLSGETILTMVVGGNRSGSGEGKITIVVF